MLQSIAFNATLWGEHDRDKPVAWRAVSYEAAAAFKLEDFVTPPAQREWNIEQSQRRALKSLERRGLITLGSYYFSPYAEETGFMHQARIYWSYTRPKDHVPGQSRIMTGIILTEAGWTMVAQIKENETN
jgi:hypothetical protein